MLEDLAFLWTTELTFSSIATVSENCFTSVLHGVWHMWTGIPAQDDCTTYHNSSAFLGFASETVFFYVTPQVFYWIQVWRLGWPLHNFHLVGLEPRYCSLTGVFGVEGDTGVNFPVPLPQKINSSRPNPTKKLWEIPSRSTPGRMTPIPSHSRVVFFLFFFLWPKSVSYSKNIVQITVCPPY